MQIVKRTRGLLAGNVGDYSNNWVGRRRGSTPNRHHGRRSLAARRVDGALSAPAVPHRRQPRSLVGRRRSGAVDGALGARGLRSARHAARAAGAERPRDPAQLPPPLEGHSMWNPAHGPAKAVQRGHWDHLVVAGHLHISGYNILRDPQSGLIARLCVGSYKIMTATREEQGSTPSRSRRRLWWSQPDAADDSPRLLTIFSDVETGADFLTFLRSKKNEGRVMDGALGWISAVAGGSASSCRAGGGGADHARRRQVRPRLARGAVSARACTSTGRW